MDGVAAMVVSMAVLGGSLAPVASSSSQQSSACRSRRAAAASRLQLKEMLGALECCKDLRHGLRRSPRSLSIRASMSKVLTVVSVCLSGHGTLSTPLFQCKPSNA